MSYEQEWVQHQALLKNLERLNRELQVAEAERNTAMQATQQEGQKHPAEAQSDANIEQLREEKAAAETKVSTFELKVAQENPQHAQWLEEKLPPAQERKIDKELTLDIADQALGLLPDDPSTSGLITQTVAHVVKNVDLMKDYTMGAVQKGIEEIKDKFFEKDGVKEWEKDIEKKEQSINDKFDKEIKETDRSLQKQLDFIEKKYNDSKEKEIKINELKETIKGVKNEIEKDRAAELEHIKDRKDNLEKIKEATKGMDEKERERIVEQQRELERKLELERQRQQQEQDRNR